MHTLRALIAWITRNPVPQRMHTRVHRDGAPITYQEIGFPSVFTYRRTHDQW